MTLISKIVPSAPTKVASPGVTKRCRLLLSSKGATLTYEYGTRIIIASNLHHGRSEVAVSS